MSSSPAGGPKPTDYLANERTFLAYIRTSLSVMAFGFVISKFSLFLRLVPGAAGTRVPATGASEYLGLAFAVFGCLLAVFGLWRFVHAVRALRADCFAAQPNGNVVVGLATVLLGIAVVVSLLRLL